MPKATTFGEFVHQRRIKMELTLRKFCEKHRLDPGNVSRMERRLLAPPQAPEKLDEWAGYLEIKKGTAAYREMLDLAAADAGRLPADLMKDEEIVKHLPLIFRTARGRGTPEDLEK